MTENICGIDVEIVRKRNKNLIIKVSKNGKVTMTVPYRFSLFEAKRFFELKLNWVKKKLLTVKPSKKVKCEDGDLIYIFGERFTLRTYCEKGVSKIDAGEISIYTLDTSKSVYDLVSDLLTKRLKEEIIRVLSDWQLTTGINCNGVTVRKTVSRWGSCNHFSKKINLSLYLINLPYPCLRYVVLHELGHILYNDHGIKFKEFLGKFMPEWKGVEKFMKENGESYKFMCLGE